MSDRDTLADLIYRVGCYDNEDAAAAAAALLLAAGVRPPARVIETAEELAAVTPMTIVHAADGTIAARHPSGVGVVFGDERPFPWSVLRAPATVLYEPGQEAQR